MPPAATEESLIEQIAAGKRIGGEDDVTPGYRGELMRLMFCATRAARESPATLPDRYAVNPFLPDSGGVSRVSSQSLSRVRSSTSSRMSPGVIGFSM